MDNNELMHWKYISKKRVNGKWQYIYDKDGDGKISLREGINGVASEARKGINRLKDKLGFDERDRLNAAYKRVSAADKRKALTARSKKVSENKHWYTKLTANVDDALASGNYAKASKEYLKAKEEFHKTPLGKISKAVEHATAGAKWLTSKIKNSTNATVKSIKDKAGVDEKERMIKAQKDRDNAKAKKAEAIRNGNSADAYKAHNEYVSKSREAIDAKEAYDKTLLGYADRAAEEYEKRRLERRKKNN